MYKKTGFRVVFLAFALMATSAYTFRCKWMCIDQSSIQQDYVAQRDECTDLAQLKVASSSAVLDDEGRKSKLTEYFNECMKQNGWDMTGKGKQVAAASAASPPEKKASLTRSSECAFARANADVSSISALRARACDLECRQALKAAPEAPRPAACPPASDESLSEGYDKEKE